tara:strand:- start:213 stop:905 length:693 start_codon:yes stop_codon:yes gene_type:complete
MIETIEYDIKKYNFVNVFQEYFGEDLTKLHKKVHFEREFSDMAGGTEEFEVVSKTYTDVIKTSSFNKLWIEFIKEVIKPYFDNKGIYIQKLPSFRIFPALHSVKYVEETTNGYNKHLDAQPPYYHPKFESNFWIPLTECNYLNDFYYWDEHDLCRRGEVRMNELLIFSSDVVHGNRVENKSSHTRCSLDFKGLAVEDYDETMLSDKIILKRGQEFKQSDWYSTKHYYMEM